MPSKDYKYVICPGTVISKTDGQRHYINAPTLMMLYGVTPKECEIHEPQEWWPLSYYDMAAERNKGKIKLAPRHDGKYVLPA